MDYRFFRSFGLGAAYRYIDYDLNVTKSKFNGGINYRFSGPMRDPGQFLREGPPREKKASRDGWPA